MTNHFIIGCGGIGCWLVPLLKKMEPKDRISVMDGDTIEERNFDRQFHQPEHLGWNKAESLYLTYGLDDVYTRYLIKQTRPQVHCDGDTVIWCCVDNHPARVACLEWIDDLNLVGIFGANELYSSQAFLYLFPWKGTRLDPRVRFPEILTDKTGDPAHPNCQGQAQEISPQLALYNFMAAGQMMHLFEFWKGDRFSVYPESWPIEHVSHLYGHFTRKRKELDP